MVNRNKSVNKQRQTYQSLVATALLTSSLFQFLAPVLAEGTAAGKEISNTATATYEDPNAPGTTINATSNTVKITVAEVAGITVTAVGSPTFKTDTNTDTKINAGDVLYYSYKVTNVGNDPTKFRVPDTVKITGPGAVETGKHVEYFVDGTGWTPIIGDVTTGSIKPGESVLVRVPIQVVSGAQDKEVISVVLGDTQGDAQNVLRESGGGDLYTVDNTGTDNGDILGDPVNGVREASATVQATVNASIKTYALATLLKTRSAYENAGTIGSIIDDKLTYDLSLRVEDTDPTGNGITPGSLTGTQIKLDGNPASRVLISDAIPKDTQFDSVVKAPAGWTAVYSTIAAENNKANDTTVTEWSTLQPTTNKTTITRIGFIFNGNIAPGTTVTGFQVKVAVIGTPTAPLKVANIAQVFGATLDNDADSTNDLLVYDESGDQSPSNYNGSTPPGPDVNGDGIPRSIPAINIDDGYLLDQSQIDAAGTDAGNNNSGSGSGGEVNLFTIDIVGNKSVLNGPLNVPSAIGPTSNDDDFTNKSSLVPLDKSAPTSKFDPSAVAFTNTFQNNGALASDISLIPTGTINGTPISLTSGTVVTITYQALSQKYVWDEANKKFLSGTTVASGTNIDATSKYITLAGITPGGSVTYGVEVNLPDGTPLSTDTLSGFPVPITAFIDDTTGGLGTDATVEPRNTTINRVYTGFLKLVKESRILKGDGPDIAAGQDTFSTTDKAPRPGNYIEYRVKYTNISDPQGGSNNNIILNANNVSITEDGTIGGTGNNWALDNDLDQKIDTQNIRNSAQDSGNANISFFSGSPATNVAADQQGTTVNNDVTKYVVKATTAVTPGEVRTFTFQRKVFLNN
ncbi:hypothetical protein LC613_15415 [Nostoc sphaeroides CHAB 2801]|uniref:DUF7925 domain-containing protein n=1 Tax=Nostoc sphaeroides TaxID=446679 RepID=UPI000E485C27|nr:hypothetical protein [Nostoc sphaeroides]MCC5629380.1 hypothetical protein [Nostoc sphaeroides CHAB 2801]